MINENAIYWITRLDYINNFLSALAVFMGFPIMFCIVKYFDVLWDRRFAYGQIEIKRINGTLKKLIIGLITSIFIALILWIARVLTPSTKEMCMIKVIPMLANSETVQQLGKDGKEIYELGIKTIKEELIRVKDEK